MLDALQPGQELPRLNGRNAGDKEQHAVTKPVSQEHGPAEPDGALVQRACSGDGERSRQRRRGARRLMTVPTSAPSTAAPADPEPRKRLCHSSGRAMANPSSRKNSQSPAAATTTPTSAPQRGSTMPIKSPRRAASNPSVTKLSVMPRTKASDSRTASPVERAWLPTRPTVTGTAAMTQGVADDNTPATKVAATEATALMISPFASVHSRGGRTAQDLLLLDHTHMAAELTSFRVEEYLRGKSLDSVEAKILAVRQGIDGNHIDFRAVLAG